MENNTQKPNKAKSNKLMSFIRNSLNNLFQTTYMTPYQQQDDMNYVLKGLNKSVNQMIEKDNETYGDVNMSSLYTRLAQKQGIQTTELQDNIFNYKNITDSMKMNFMKNRELVEYRTTIDTLIKFMPILEDVLNVKANHVLSADHYTRDFLNFVDTNHASEESKDVNYTFESNIKYIKEKYDLLNFCEREYKRCARYGEAPIYIAPYNKEFGKLLQQCKENNNDSITEATISVSDYKKNYADTYNDYIDNGTISAITESSDVSKLEYNNKSGGIKVKINMTGIIESAYKYTEKGNEVLNETAKLGLNKMKPLVPTNLGFEGVQDGLILGGKQDKKNSNKNYDDPKLDIRGSVLKPLKPENLVTQYMDDIPMGYFYIECDNRFMIDKNNTNFFQGNMSGLIAKTTSVFGGKNLKNKDHEINFISQKITKMIDKKFIMDNQDLKKEIYLILKNNKIAEGSQVTVTYIPPSDIIYMKFNEDTETHRGLSDLDKSIIPASMYVGLETSNAIGILTRGFDKRVYYVKQRVDTNISGVLMNVIGQLQRGNMGTRELCNPKTVLRVTGRYNDHVIPVGPSGDSPVSIENLQGQDIDTKQDFMEQLKEQTIGPTDVPLDFVDSTKQVDFATRLTMSSYKFLTAVYARQAMCNKFFAQIIQKLYDSEFPSDNEDENNLKTHIVCQLPTPAYLDQMAVSEVFRVTNDYSTGLAEVEYPDDNDEDIQLKRKLFIRMHNKAIMGNQIDSELIENIIKQVDMKVQTYKKASNDDM